MSKDINHTRMNLGQTLKENYSHKYTHKYNNAVLDKYPMDTQMCRTMILDWTGITII